MDYESVAVTRREFVWNIRALTFCITVLAFTQCVGHVSTEVKIQEVCDVEK